jgi:hypothetical protein
MHRTRSEGDQTVVPTPPSDQLGGSADWPEVIENDGPPIAENSTTSDPVNAVYGILGMKQSTDAAIRSLRGTPDSV